MNLDDYVIDEYDPNKGRMLKDGHSITPFPGRIVCACGWFVLVNAEMDKETAEELAWQHRTKPQLIMKGTSDLLLPGRLRRMP